MGFVTHITIDSKVFSISKNGKYVIIMEKSRKVFEELKLAFLSVHWFVKFIHDCLRIPHLERTIDVSLLKYVRI